MKYTLLVAEDEKINYIYISEILEDQDFQLIRAIDGKQAVDICKKADNIDAVLMDIKMPVMDGYQATSAIKKIKPGLPVIANTAYALSEDRKKALESGCDDYITKPIRKNQLLRILNKYMSGDS